MSAGGDQVRQEQRELANGRHGPWVIEYVESTGSTNVLAAADPIDRRVVVTNHQQAGKGRLGRAWETPAGVALTFSATVDPHLPDSDWPWVPLLAGEAVAAVMTDLGLRAEVKWPNDVLIDGAKIAGILVERVQSGSGRPLAVVGIGLNVHQQTLPVAAATSLALEGVRIDRADLLERMLRSLGERDDVIATVMTSVAQSLAEKHMHEVAGLSAEQLAAQVTASLKAEGILEHWRSEADGIHLVNGRCPYHKAAEISKLPCEADRKTIELLLGHDVEQLNRIVDGAACCEYLVRTPAEPQIIEIQ